MKLLLLIIILTLTVLGVELYFLWRPAQPKFGRHLMKEFMLDKDFINLNNGGRGSVPNVVGQAKYKWIQYVESNPDYWYRTGSQIAVNNAIEVIAKYLGCKITNVAFVENASDGFNAAIKSVDLQPGDNVLRSNLAYPMVNTLLEYLTITKNLNLITVNYTQDDMNDGDKMIDKMRLAIQQYGKIKVAVIDHISSGPSIVFPVKELVQLFHQNNIMVIIDGAHAVGQLPLNMTEIGADYYLSNFHKWFYANKNSAFLYVSDYVINTTHPNIISFNLGKGYGQEFFYTGTRDYSSYLTVNDSLNFRAQFGEEAIMNYQRDLAWEGGNLAAKEWNTDLFVTNRSMVGAMIMVRQPTTDPKISQRIIEDLQKKYTISISGFEWNGIQYARMSAAIFNDMFHFEKAIGLYIKLFLEYTQGQDSVENHGFIPKGDN